VLWCWLVLCLVWCCGLLIVRFTVKVAFFGLASLIVRLNSTSVGSIPVVFTALMWGIMSWISIVWL